MLNYMEYTTKTEPSLKGYPRPCDTVLLHIFAHMQQLGTRIRSWSSSNST